MGAGEINILSVYSNLSKRIHLTNSIEEAETAKVIENIQRDVNIALMNELAMMFEKMNIDLGLDLQKSEIDIFENYRGRWNKNA